MANLGSSVYTLLYGDRPAQLTGVTRDERTAEILSVIRVKGDPPAFLRVVHPSRLVAALTVERAFVPAPASAEEGGT